MKIFKLDDRKEYIKEYCELCLDEWGKYSDVNEFNIKVANKTEKILSGNDEKIISVLLLLDGKNLVGFISLLKVDGEERQELTPWYGTMYVKKEYRKKGYSKILNNAILEEAKKLGYKRVFLKTNLINYYEKLGAKFVGELNNGEKLYSIEI